MFSVLHSRFSYANVVATLALVFAMSGGALAASKFLIVSTKQIKPSVLKQLKGKNGKDGAPGAQGPTGPAGPTGPQGAGGVNGKDGASGSNGTSATTTAFAGAQHGCKEGGLEVKSASPATFVCNGEIGARGPEGSPWTVNGVLPKGKTETGTWSINHFETVTAPVSLNLVPISFPIQLAEGGEAVYVSQAESASKKGTSGCTGDASDPTAPEGVLCVYADQEEYKELAEPVAPVNVEEKRGEYSKSGAYLEISIKKEGNAFSHGSWAVTAK